MIKETKEKFDKLVNDARIYFESMKRIPKGNIEGMDNINIMSVRGMCRMLLKSYVMINDTLRQFPEFATEESADFSIEFFNFNQDVKESFMERIDDIDSPDLEEIIEEYKNSVRFLESWLLKVYNPTVDLFTSMNPKDIQDYTINITFNQICKHWHHKDVLLGICDDLYIYRSRLHEVGKKLDFLYSLVNNARINKA